MKLIVSLVLLLVGSNVFAAGRGTGKVTLIAVTADSHVLVETSVPGVAGNSTKPECSAGDKRYVGDLNTEHGKAMFSLLLAAQAQGLDVIVGGRNSCTVREGIETIQYVTLIP